MTMPFLYQLQGADFRSLSAQEFQVAVIDMDDAALGRGEVRAIERQGKTLITYLSIGEAEDYRAYWEAFGPRRPDIVLDENPDWEGNYRVRFWDGDWQRIVLDRIEEAVAKGYSGVYLDIVDAYAVRSVEAAYDGGDIRQAMIDFVAAISRHAKRLDPDFLVVPQNAVELLSAKDDPGAPNRAYLGAIDGVGVEDLWFDDDRSASWTRWDLEHLETAREAGKFVLATSYPRQDAKQAEFVAKAVEAGFVPFVGERDLDGRIDPINATIGARLAGREVGLPGGGDRGEQPASPSHVALEGGGGPDVLEGSSQGELILGGGGNDALHGHGGKDTLWGGRGADRLHGGADDDLLRGGAGPDWLHGGPGDDVLHGGPGRDRLRGGAGDDRLIFDADDFVIHGGAGFDTLVVRDAAAPDLGARAFGAIEAVDLANGVRNALSLNWDDVRRMTDDGALRITGDPGDAVRAGVGRPSGTVVEDGTAFARFDGDGLALLVELGLTVNGEILT